MDVKEIIDLMRKQPTPVERAKIEKALYFAVQAHQGQTRFSGEPYINHPFAVAKILAELRADPETIMAGLLHDTVEDEKTSLETIEKEFGKTVAFMVDGVTKLGKLKYRGVTRHVESLRKFFMAMAKDFRVIIIRLADRLHNMQTLEFVRPDKQVRIALETLEIYAPLANRLGMWKVKGLLEDLAFPYVYPTEYEQVVELRKTKGKETIKRLEKIERTLNKEATLQNIPITRMSYRLKYLYSLYRKLQKHHMDISQIYDISGLRIIVPEVNDCYRLLGLVHSLWKPVPGRLKDYIANPKPNGYQSLHTAVFTADGQPVEMQIRSVEMQNEAQYGVASYMVYAENKPRKKAPLLSKKLAWINDLIEWQKHTHNEEEFLTHLKGEFFQDRIFTFTPTGDVIELPKGATAIDFAYTIHSNIGHRANGAIVNGTMRSLDYVLNNHDRVQIDLKKEMSPSRKWLQFTTTTVAKKHIKQFLQKAEVKKTKERN